MANLDLSGTNTSDSATLDAAGRIIVSDSLTLDKGLQEATGATAYLVRPSGATSVGAVLGDALVNDFDSTGLPFGPGDFTGGAQWKDRVLPVGGRLSIPFTLAVNAVQPFLDVSAASFAMTNIMAIKAAGITTGCGGGNYCASGSVSRQEMAAFLVRAVEGEPPAGYCGTTNPFLDVPFASGMCGYIKRLSELGITTGCGGGNYCPLNSVSRQEMAAFLVRAVEGEPAAGYCGTTNPFTDVPYTSGLCGYIKRLSELGITTGCGGGNYCPIGLVTREQMGAFLARAFLGM